MIRAFYDMELFYSYLRRACTNRRSSICFPATICNGCVRNASAMLYASYVMI